MIIGYWSFSEVEKHIIYKEENRGLEPTFFLRLAYDMLIVKQDQKGAFLEGVARALWSDVFRVMLIIIIISRLSQ